MRNVKTLRKLQQLEMQMVTMRKNRSFFYALFSKLQRPRMFRSRELERIRKILCKPDELSNVILKLAILVETFVDHYS